VRRIGPLRPKGALFISMPDSESILWDQMSASRTNPCWSEIEHYHDFGRPRLFALLAQTGYKVATTASASGTVCASKSTPARTERYAHAGACYRLRKNS
jgi:hypothetical protein